LLADRSHRLAVDGTWADQDHMTVILGGRASPHVRGVGTTQADSIDVEHVPSNGAEHTRSVVEDQPDTVHGGILIEQHKNLALGVDHEDRCASGSGHNSNRKRLERTQIKTNGCRTPAPRSSTPEGKGSERKDQQNLDVEYAAQFQRLA